MRRTKAMYIASIAFAVFAGAAVAGDHDYYAEPLASRYDARRLPAFETARASVSADADRKKLSAAVEQVATPARLSEKDLRIFSSLAEKETLWEGELDSDSQIEFRFDRRAARLEIVNYRVQNRALREGATELESQESAIAVALRTIEGLHAVKVIDRSEFDLKDLRVGVQKMGSGPVGKPFDRTNERIVDYVVTAKRVIDGVPVVGSFVSVIVHVDGRIGELRISNLPLKSSLEDGRAVPTGQGAFVPIDTSPAEAKERLRKEIQPDSDSWLHVERWGLAYIDTGAAGQRFLQPAYVFLVSQLTQRPEGVIAGRKGVKVVPASTRLLEPLAFDPLVPVERKPIAGDKRTLSR